MLKDKLLIGQYYETHSPLHRLDARSKIIATVIYMVLLFVANNWLGYGLLATIFVVVTVISRIPVISFWRGMKLILFFCILTVALNIFLYGENIIWQWRFLKITGEGVSHGLAMGLRLLLLVTFASLLTLSTKPIQLTDGLERLFSPLQRIGIPAHEIAIMMSIALRFIPTILEEFDRIMLAQRARGANFSKGNIFHRVKQLVPLLVPLFVGSFRRAEELAQAMDAKCYRGGQGRSHWRPSRWLIGDTLFLGIFLMIAAVVAALRIY
jgi:energy-coupling factor transport system permease protein